MNSGMNPQLLGQAAVDAAERAYCRYSGYRVGAALVTEDGTLYTGSNIENSSNPVTICAERTAISQAISDGHRKLAALAVFTPNGGTPCGICRQVINEFGEGAPIIITSESGILYQTDLETLLPDAFGPRHMQHKLAEATQYQGVPTSGLMNSGTADLNDLAQYALDARRRAYAPYSQFPIGSALLTADGTIFTAASVENACIAANICAPHGAFLRAVSAGYAQFTTIAIASEDASPPCGICRQVIAEFAPTITITLVDQSGRFSEARLPDVMAMPFGLHPA